MENRANIDSAVHERLRSLLLQSEIFAQGDRLRSLFSDPRLQPWANHVPEVPTAAGRVDATVLLLQGREHVNGEPALVLLLQALRDRVDAHDAQHAALGALAAEIRRDLAGVALEPAPETAEPAPGFSPFKGLHYYDVEDAADFFGRETLTAKVMEMLDAPQDTANGDPLQWIVLVGPAGIGKTSLLRAGVTPALAADERSLVHLLTPTAQPLQQLAAALTPESDSLRQAAAFVDDMQAEPRSLSLYAHRLLQDSGASRLVLIVDHFEELFTLCREEGLRQAFVHNLLTASNDGPVTVITALDNAFVAAAEAYEPLRVPLSERCISIGRMSEAELRRAITEPALRGGWRFESGLVTRILQDVEAEPNALPMLSQALHGTWQERVGHTLTHRGYQTAGEVSGAVGRIAEEVYGALGEEEQAMARAVCLRLVIPREEGGSYRLPRDARALTPRSELASMANNGSTVDEVLKAMVREHLLVMEGEIVALAQETVLHAWPRLQQWVDAERGRLRQHWLLTLDARRWQEKGKDESLTYRGNALAEAETYTDDPVVPLSGLEQAFLHDSRRAELRRARQEQERQQQIRRTALAAAPGGALGMVLAIWLTYRTLAAVPELFLVITVVDAFIGAIAGGAIVLLVDFALSATERDEASRCWRCLALAAAAGAAAFAVLFGAHALFTARWPPSPGPYLLVMVEGACWGAAIGLGRALMQQQSDRPSWQLLILIALVSSLVLVLGERVGHAFSLFEERAPLAAVAAAGALVPLFILGAAEVGARAFSSSGRSVSHD